LIWRNELSAPVCEDGSVRPTGDLDMNHKHRAVLEAIFAHPTSGNIDFKEAVHALEALGAEVVNKSGNRIGVSLNGHTVALSHAHHDLPKDEVIQIKKFLETCGVGPGTVGDSA
jgi:hypothetical protein